MRLVYTLILQYIRLYCLTYRPTRMTCCAILIIFFDIFLFFILYSLFIRRCTVNYATLQDAICMYLFQIIHRSCADKSTHMIARSVQVHSPHFIYRSACFLHADQI
jgi:hypothetical protein